MFLLFKYLTFSQPPISKKMEDTTSLITTSLIECYDDVAVISDECSSSSSQQPPPQQPPNFDLSDDKTLEIVLAAIIEHNAHVRSSPRGRWENVTNSLASQFSGIPSRLNKILPPKFATIRVRLQERKTKGEDLGHLGVLLEKIEADMIQDKASHPKYYNMPKKHEVVDVSSATIDDEPAPKKHKNSEARSSLHQTPSEELILLKQILVLLTEKRVFLHPPSSDFDIVYDRIDHLYSQQFITESEAYKATILADDPINRKKMETLPERLLAAWIKYIDST